MADQASTAVRRGLAKPPSDEELRKTFLTAGQYLRDGLSSKAEDLLLRSLAKYTYPPDEFADLKRLLSFTLETLGKYKE